ncbi:MAG TPA: hypothetical protein VJ856_02095 [Paludibacteraceae bacterium]|nr:hypothetical protein [Paludibacteraceae bacterium]
MTHSFIAPNLFVGEEHNISIGKNKKSIISGITFLIIGIASVVAMITIPLSGTDSLPIIWSLIPATCITVGFIQLFFGKKTYTYKPTQSPLRGGFFFCTSGKGQETISTIQAKNWSHLQKLITTNESSVKVEFITSADKTFARCQVFTFIPYDFEPLSDVIALTSAEIEELLKVTGTKL